MKFEVKFYGRFTFRGGSTSGTGVSIPHALGVWRRVCEHRGFQLPTGFEVAYHIPGKPARWFEVYYKREN